MYSFIVIYILPISIYSYYVIYVYIYNKDNNLIDREYDIDIIHIIVIYSSIIHMVSIPIIH
jgi:hypothetical protein